MGDVFEYITWEYYQVAEGDRILYRSFFLDHYGYEIWRGIFFAFE